RRRLLMGIAQSEPQHKANGRHLPVLNGINSLTELITPLHREHPLPAQPAMDFFTDTSLCIGCKACEFSCKQWTQLPAPDPRWSGTSYDNTGQLSATTWRHVQFIEQIGRRDTKQPRPVLPLFENQLEEARGNGTIPTPPPGTALPFFNTDR